MTSPVKLTAAQRRALERMAAGGEVWTTGGINSSTFWYGTVTPGPSHATLHVLWRRGLVEDYEPSGAMGSKYRLNAAGRALLSETEDDA